MNTGAILNRINFGMAAAAGRLPGINVRRLPALDSVRAAAREKQVDVVVSNLLNGMVSPDTRAVLVSGEHPMLANAGKTGVPDVAAASEVVARTSESDMTTASGEVGSSANPRRPNQNAGGRRAALQGRPIGNLPQLTGLPQIVGLALGSPEFQRR